MQDLPVMNMLHPETNLCEPVKNLAFAEIPTSLGFDSLLHVATIGIVHDNMHLLLLSFVDFSEFDDVWMAQSVKNLGFFDSFFALF
jgi:hypothetical protein